jgi:hypothetical protein
MGGLPIIEQEEVALMPEWLWFVVFFAAYIVLMRWVLPRFGVPT